MSGKKFRKFVALTPRQALQDIKEALGEDAVILSNRKVDGGVEVIAIAGEAMAQLTDGLAAESKRVDSLPKATLPASSLPVKNLVAASKPLIPSTPSIKPVTPPPKLVEVAKNPAPAPISNEWKPDPVLAEVIRQALPKPPSDNQVKSATVRTPIPELSVTHPVLCPPLVLPPIVLPPVVKIEKPVQVKPAQDLSVCELLADIVDSASHEMMTEEKKEDFIMKKQASASPTDNTKKKNASLPVVKSAPALTPAPQAKLVKQTVLPPVAVHGKDASTVMEGGQHNILLELKSMRQQISALSWGNAHQQDPDATDLLGKLLNSGFSALLAHQLIGNRTDKKNQGEAWVKQILKCNLRAATEQEDIATQGGVYALVGPTGAGKTTTTSKLAARAVVRYGASKVALLTTDSYRIGAYEQLRIYGKILGISVHAVKDAEDLNRTLASLKSKHLVLIDTVGMGQRDDRVPDQDKMLHEAGVKQLLLLNSTSSGETLDEVVRMYGKKTIGCILTKLDEAATLGATLDIAVRHKLLLHYMTNGQRVPEDLHTINLDYLLHRSLKAAEVKTPFTLSHLDIPAFMSRGVMGGTEVVGAQ